MFIGNIEKYNSDELLTILCKININFSKILLNMCNLAYMIS